MGRQRNRTWRKRGAEPAAHRGRASRLNLAKTTGEINYSIGKRERQRSCNPPPPRRSGRFDRGKDWNFYWLPSIEVVAGRGITNLAREAQANMGGVEAARLRDGGGGGGFRFSLPARLPDCPCPLVVR